MNSKNKKNNIFLMAFDTLFIMILCFATLLSAMLIQGDVIGGVKYCINWTTLTITLIGLGIYLAFILSQSNKGLKLIIIEMYKDE